MAKLINKFKGRVVIGAVCILVCLLGFVIYLGVVQHETVHRLSVTADRMQINIDILTKDLEKRKAAEAAANELENQTTEDMKGLN